MASCAERQRKHRARQREAGFVSLTLMVPYEAVAELAIQAEALRTNPKLAPGPLRNPRTGRLISAKSVLTPNRNAGNDEKASG